MSSDEKQDEPERTRDNSIHEKEWESESEPASNGEKKTAKRRQKRGKYKKYDRTTYDALLAAHESSPEDLFVTARNLKVPPSSVRNIIKRMLSPDAAAPRKRGGRRESTVKMTQEVKELLVKQLDDNPTTTLKQYKESLASHGHDIGKSTISKALLGMLYTVKKVDHEPVSRNSPETKARRKAYAEWLLHTMGQPEATEFIYVDEMGLNVWTTNSRGRARRGQRCRIKVYGNRGPKISVLAAVCDTVGLICYTTVRGSFNADTYAAFIGDIARDHHGRFARTDRVFVIQDNAPFHKAAAVKAAVSGTKFELVSLPVSSPMLNPVEEMWSVWKAGARSMITDLRYDLAEPPRGDGQTLDQAREVLLRQVVDHEVGRCVTAEVIRRQIRRSVSFLLPATQKEDL